MLVTKCINPRPGAEPRHGTDRVVEYQSCPYRISVYECVYVSLCVCDAIRCGLMRCELISWLWLPKLLLLLLLVSPVRWRLAEPQAVPPLAAGPQRVWQRQREGLRPWAKEFLPWLIMQKIQCKCVHAMNKSFQFLFKFPTHFPPWWAPWWSPWGAPWWPLWWAPGWSP